MTFLKKMRTLSASKPHCHSRLSKLILKILRICRKKSLGKEFSQAMCSKYVFRLLHVPKFQIFPTKLNMMIKVVKLFTGVLFYKEDALMNFIGKHLCYSLFLNKVLRLQGKERLLHRCFPVSIT